MAFFSTALAGLVAVGIGDVVAAKCVFVAYLCSTVVVVLSVLAVCAVANICRLLDELCLVF